MKTGWYRVRRNWLGQAILQEEVNYPSFIGGQVNSSIRKIIWEDSKFNEISHKVFQEGMGESAYVKSKTPPANDEDA